MPGRRVARRTARRATRRAGRRNPVRRAGAGLLGAAVVGGAGYYAGKKISEGRQADAYEQQQDVMQDQQIAELQNQLAYQQAAPPPPPAPTPAPAPAVPGAGSDTVAQLQQLSQLHDSGVLTDDEFAAAKQKVLVGG